MSICLRRTLGIGLFFTLVLIAGCAHSVRATASNDAIIPFWQGRLTLRIDSDPVQSISAGFELTGTPQTGELVLLSPLGSTLVNMAWTPHTATLRANGQVSQFDSLAELVQQATGTDLPVEALFLWLAGKPANQTDWQADLSGLPAGRLSARRLHPEPRIELRMALEK